MNHGGLIYFALVAWAITFIAMITLLQKAARLMVFHD